MFHRDAVDRRLHALSCEARARHRRRRLHRQQPRRPRCSRDGVEVVVYDNFSHRPARVRRRLRERRRDARRGRRARPRRARRRRWRAATRSSTCRPTPTCATASSTRAWTSSRTRSPPRTCSRRCAPRASTRIAFSSTGSVYGEPEVFPTPEDAPVPGPDLALRGLQARGRGPDRRLLPRLRLHRRRLPLRLDPRRALHARPRVRLLPRAAARPDAAARARRRPPARRPTCTCGDCVERHPDRAATRPSPGFAVYNLGTDETIVVDDSIATICAHLGRRRPSSSTPAATRGWAGDCPLIHLDTAKIRALGWAPTADHPRGRRADAGLVRGQPEIVEEAA